MTTTTGAARADLGLIGGSGFYEFFEDAERVSVTTPYGDPSDDVVMGEVEGRAVAFVARHGEGHRFQPHRVNYRANLWALWSSPTRWSTGRGGARTRSTRRRARSCT
jgi:5'-methylthioadenosine phosphorylase